MAGNRTRVSKIVKYQLEEDCAYLHKLGLNNQQIADELNSSGKVPPDDKITPFVVMTFLNKVLPEVSKQLVKKSEERILQVVNTNFDVIQEVNLLYARTKNLLDDLEQQAREKNKPINPYHYKAVVSEMREMLNTMLDIQKEVNDYQNIRKFMEIVLEVLSEEVPDKIPIIVEKLRLSRGTTWFASVMNREVD